MLRNALAYRLAAGMAAVSMIGSPALAASPALHTVDPLVAVALLSTPQSRDALCAARSASSVTDPATVAKAASDATASNGENGQTVVNGCVLPINDVAAVPATQNPALATTILPNYSFGLPVLLLAASVALLTAIKGFGDNGEGDGAALSPA